MTDIDGEITQHVAYIPYGEVFVEERNGSWNTPYLFNAKELDEETGLYYYGARYLDPTHAAWLSVDPMFEKYVGMTPYGYCAGNPVGLVDVDGRDYIQKEDGKLVYTREDLVQHGAEEGKEFTYLGVTGIYKGKTCTVNGRYYSLFNQNYDANSTTGLCVKALDEGLMQYLKKSIDECKYLSQGIGTEGDFTNTSFKTGFTDENKSVLAEEHIHYFKYAGLTDVGEFHNNSGPGCMYGNFGGFLSDNKNVRLPVSFHRPSGFTSYKKDVSPYTICIMNTHNNPIAYFKFPSDKNANIFLKSIYRLFPEYAEVTKSPYLDRATIQKRNR